MSQQHAKILRQSLAARTLLASLLFFTLPICAYFVNQIWQDGERSFNSTLEHIEDVGVNRALDFELIFEKYQRRKLADLISMGFDVQALLQKVSNYNHKDFNLTVSLLTTDNVIYASTDEKFMKQVHHLGAQDQLLQLTTLKNSPYTLEMHSKQLHKIGVMVPINNSDLKILVSFDYHQVFKQRDQKLKALVYLFIFITIVSSLLTWAVLYVLSYPLVHLKRMMLEVTKGDMSARYRPQPFGFEINKLGQIFNDSLQALMQSLEKAEAERVARKTLARELEIGRQIQQSLLPQSLPDFKALELATCYLPAKEVSGDFYDVIKKEDHLPIFTIADGAGKGISACFYSLSLRSLLRSAIGQSSVGKMLMQANRLFCMDTGETGHFATAISVMYDRDRSQISFSNCGHLPGLLVRANGELEELLQQGTLPLGVDEDSAIHTDTRTVNEGDYLVLYTDGITEANNIEKELYGDARFQEALLDLADGNRSAQEVLDGLIKEVNTFTMGADQFDDITLLVIKFIKKL